jgi:adenylate cyclase
MLRAIYNNIKRRGIPITVVTVVGTSTLLAVAVASVLFLGLSQAAKSTRQLWADQSATLIRAMEESLAYQLRPITEQARWVAGRVHDISKPSDLDGFMFGVLAATPQVEGVAVVAPGGSSRRWHRDGEQAISEDWSADPGVMSWLASGVARTGPTWRTPIWAEAVSAVTLLHDIPLRDKSGNFIGMFAQIVPVAELSHYLSRVHSNTGLTPFVLYDKQYVLAHPLLINASMLGESEGFPLPALESFDDALLSRIWTPDEDDPFISELLADVTAKGVYWGDDHYLFLYREVAGYGPTSWTVGAYLSSKVHVSDEAKRLLTALGAGLLVLLVAIAAAIYVGRKVSIPVEAIADAAKTVKSGNIDSVAVLKSSRVRELDDAANAFNAMVSGLRERELIRKTLGRFVPEKVASTLLAGGGTLKAEQVDATILFCDIVAFTTLTEQLGPVRIVDLLNTYFSTMVTILEQHGGVVTQFQGDAILATFNVPIENIDHADNAVHAALAMLEAIEENQFAGQTLRARIGINTGAVVAGAIGAEGRLNYTVHGDAVNLAARLEALNKRYGTYLIVSENTTVRSRNFDYVPVGEATVRGQSGRVRLYTVAR